MLTALVAFTAALVAAPPGASAAPADEAPPATIRVCRDTYGGGEVVEVSFKDYVKTVLPYEYGSSTAASSREYLRAGAIAIKSYAWWWTQHPYRDRCDISDGGNHQHYRPGQGTNPPNAATDQAVEDIWHLRLEDGDTGGVLFASYCNCSHFRDGAHIQQRQAREQSAAGWSFARIISHAYRNVPGRLVDWRAGLGIGLPGDDPFAFGEGEPALRITTAIAGVAPGDPRARASLWVLCTIDGIAGPHLLQEVGIGADSEGRPIASFDSLGRIDGCQQDEVGLSANLTVNGWLGSGDVGQAWRPWKADGQREVARVASTNDPIHGAIAISEQLFEDPTAPASSDRSLTDELMGSDGESESTARTAEIAVLARSDRFPDALTATGLAASAGPILLTAGGPSRPLDPAVGEELERLLEPGATVYLVGGVEALSGEVAREVEELGFEPRRLEGDGRVGTSLAVASQVRGLRGPVGTVLVARAWPDGSAGWADAVTSGAFAAATGIPVLLTGTDTLDPEVEAWIEDPDNGVDEVILLGGTAAVPGDAEQRLDGVRVQRVKGESRAATATAVADTLWTRPEAPDITRAVIIDAYDDRDWTFAVPAAVYSAIRGAPQLVVTGLVPKRSTGRWLETRAQLPAVVVGGHGVVVPRIDEDLGG